MRRYVNWFFVLSQSLKGLGVIATTIVLAGEMAGGGVLSLPYAIESTGELSERVFHE